MINSTLIKNAFERISGYISHTPLIESIPLSKLSGASVYLKCENYQLTGSFKIRGACNKLLSYQEMPSRIIAASTGNHGKAISYLCSKLKCHAQIYVPKNVSPIKKQGIQNYGAEIIEVSGASLEAEMMAQKDAQLQNIPFIHPYNDEKIIAGQGTIGVEIAMQGELPDAVFIAVGGGGLLSGIASYLKSIKPDIEIVGCWPENSAAMYESLEANQLVESIELPTLSDGTAGGIVPNAITYPLCKQFIGTKILVNEEEIASAMRLILQQEQMVIEGAAGVAVAGFLKIVNQYQGRKVSIILCGRNVDFHDLISS